MGYPLFALVSSVQAFPAVGVSTSTTDGLILVFWQLGNLHLGCAASEGYEGSHQTILLARRTRTMKRCSSDARSEGQSGDSLGEKV
jgi:hypothetical protein